MPQLRLGLPGNTVVAKATEPNAIVCPLIIEQKPIYPIVHKVWYRLPHHEIWLISKRVLSQQASGTRDANQFPPDRLVQSITGVAV